MKKIKLIIYSILLIFLSVIKVNAFSDTIGPILQEGSKVTTNGTDTLALKYYGTTAVFCTQFQKPSPALGNASCSKVSSNWSGAIQAGVASIIRNVGTVTIKGDDSIDAPAKYYYGELAINEFLCNSGVDTSNTCVRSSGTGNASSVLGDYYSWYTTAMDVKDNYVSSASITFSSSTLTFTKNGDNYISNTIKITNNISDNYSIKSSLGKVVQSGKNFYVSVPASSVTAGSTVNVSVEASISRTNYTAQNYSCGSNYQTVTPNLVETKTISDSAKATGSITVAAPKATLTINKYDGNNKHLSGATIKITGPNNYSKTVTSNGSAIVLDNLELGKYTITEVTPPSGYTKAEDQTINFTDSVTSGTITIKNNKNKVTISKVDATGTAELPGATLEIQDSNGKTIHQWVSTTTSKVIEGLAAGKYYLVETIAPDGYVLSKEKVEFEITTTTTTETVKMANKLNSITILKIDADTNKALPGAILEIQDSKGNIVKYCTDSDGTKNTECKWISTNKGYTITGLPKGKYYLVETFAPDKYVLNKEKVEFEVKATTETLSVKMENKKNLVKILKINSVDKKGLAGATLQLVDKDGKIIKYCTDLKGNENTECKWVSTDKEYEIVGLPNGTYYLEEIKAPDGYELNKERIEIKVDGSKEVIEVELLNQLEVEVPDTMSSRSALLLAIAMFDIALGIGIVTYVKKNKIEE